MDDDFDGRIKDMVDGGDKKGPGLTRAVFYILVAASVAAIGYFAWNLMSSIYPPVTDIKMMEYASRHGFSIRYPEGWRVDSAQIESYRTLEEAESIGANHFDVFSYPADNNYNPGDPVPRKELKIETIVYSDITKSDSDWNSSFSNIIKTEPFTVDGKPAKKIWQKWGSFYNSLSIIYTEGKKGVILNCWPANSRYVDVFYRIASSFRFTR